MAFQHVVWNATTGCFENAGVCTYKSGRDYSAINRALMNVHTSEISAYPSEIFLHNYASFSISYRGDVFRANNGLYIGSFYFNLGPNDTGSETFSTTRVV